MIERSVPGLRSRREWTGTVTVRVAGEDRDVMTASDPVRRESRARQDSNEVTAVQDRQLSVDHV